MVLLYSALLIVGILSGQVFNLASFAHLFTFVASVCLAYIMMEVGLEFSLEKREFKSYGWDFLIASTAAVLPVILCVSYFLMVVKSDWKAALLAGLSSAPTSAGVLFAMMMAAGLSATWVYKKARVLAILDDLVTILLLIPLQIIINGFQWLSMASFLFTAVFLWASFNFQNSIKVPTSKPWLLCYGLGIAGLSFLVHVTTGVNLGVLMPAFMMGCLLKYHQGEDNSFKLLDSSIKGLFMLMVGLTLPKITVGSISLTQTVVHILVLTILANLGKFFLVACYKNEASFKERVALGIAMFPRGEVGAAVLLLGIGYGLGGYANSLATLSLALNLVLTGFFIWLVIKACR